MKSGFTWTKRSYSFRLRPYEECEGVGQQFHQGVLNVLHLLSVALHLSFVYTYISHLARWRRRSMSLGGNLHPISYVSELFYLREQVSAFQQQDILKLPNPNRSDLDIFNAWLDERMYAADIEAL